MNEEWMNVHIYLCIYIQMHINVRRYIYICIYTYTYMYEYIYICIHIYTYIYAYVYIYTNLPNRTAARCSICCVNSLQSWLFRFSTRVGLCNVTVDTIVAARQVVEIVSVQNKFSLWERDAETKGVLEVIRVTWPFRTCNMTHSRVWPDAFLRDMTRPYVWHDASMRVKWRIYVCDIAHP